MHRAVSAPEQEASECFDLGHAALCRADLAAAKSALERCVALAPGNVDAWCYLGMALIAREPERAARALDNALDVNPNHLGALYWRAETYWVDGDARSAAMLLKRLNDIVPGVSPNLARLGLAYLHAGDTAAAMEELRRAVEVGGGIAAAAASTVELRRAVYLDLLGRHDEAVRLIESVNGGGLTSRHSSSRYPRDLQKQASALERLVMGRDIVILGSGPSLEKLPASLESLGQKACESLCFFGFNNVPVAESMLREVIGRQVDVACMTSAAVTELHHEWLQDFLGRSASRNLFLTLVDALPKGRATAEMITAHPEKLFYFAASGDHLPNPEDPLHIPPINTLMCVLPLAVLGRPRRIFLFGCDGAAPAALESGADVYFRQGHEAYGNQTVANERYARWLVRDTFFFNAMIMTVLTSLSVLHRVPPPPVYICNPESAYRPFPRIDACDFLTLQKAGADKP